MSAENCPDCGVKPGSLHQIGCDVERCRLCGGQSISCGCVVCSGDEPTAAEWAAHDQRVEDAGGRLPWTGEWPGDSECREFGLWSKLVRGHGWQMCSADDPAAQPDLNRLSRFPWDAKLGRRVRPEPAA